MGKTLDAIGASGHNITFISQVFGSEVGRIRYTWNLSMYSLWDPF